MDCTNYDDDDAECICHMTKYRFALLSASFLFRYSTGNIAYRSINQLQSTCLERSVVY